MFGSNYLDLKLRYKLILDFLSLKYMVKEVLFPVLFDGLPDTKKVISPKIHAQHYAKKKTKQNYYHYNM